MSRSSMKVMKGSKWIGHGGYFSGRIVVDRVQETPTETWIRFELDGHGTEEISLNRFLHFFRPYAA